MLFIVLENTEMNFVYQKSEHLHLKASFLGACLFNPNSTKKILE